MKLKNFENFILESYISEMSKIESIKLDSFIEILKDIEKNLSEEKKKGFLNILNGIKLDRVNPYKSSSDEIINNALIQIKNLDSGLYNKIKMNLHESLWDNIHRKRERGETPARKGSDAYKKAVKAGEKILKESEIDTESEYNEYAKNILKKAHNEDYDEEKAKDIISRILKRADGDFGKAIGILTSSLGESTIYESEESYNDYPESARNAARKAIKWKDEYGRDVVKGGTAVGWTRASQLANGEKLSMKTIKRMKAFFDRHEKNKTINPEYKNEPWRDNGYVSHLIWGGDSARAWAERKIKQYENKK